MKFSVKNLAQIKEAEIELKPLTIFVGKNSTNKTYMAHVVYEITKYFAKWNNVTKFRPIFLTLAFKELISNVNEVFTDVLEEKLKKIDAQNKKELVFKKEEIMDLTEDFLKRIEQLLNSRISKSFNTKKNQSKKFTIKIHVKGLNIHMKPLKIDFNFLEQLLIERQDKNNFIRNNLLIEILEKFIVRFINVFKKNGINFEKVFYFPASRMGFVLAFDDIMSGIFRERFGGRPTTRLTKPVIDFLSNFADIKNHIKEESGEGVKNLNEELQLIIKFFRERIIKGKIVEKKEENKYVRFYYQPISLTDKELEMHVVSSSTIELLPIIEFLKTFKKLKNSLWIIEEPEAHLHPHAQVEMARFLTLMVNSGANVLITTHSDYIIHEISNCIRLFHVNDEVKQEFLQKNGLDKFENIAISKDKVGVYLFSEKGKKRTKVEVKKMDVDEFGIEDKNFEHILNQLIDHSAFLGEKLSEDEK